MFDLYENVIDLAQSKKTGGAGSWNDLKDKPFGNIYGELTPIDLNYWEYNYTKDETLTSVSLAYKEYNLYGPVPTDIPAEAFVGAILNWNGMHEYTIDDRGLSSDKKTLLYSPFSDKGTSYFACVDEGATLTIDASRIYKNGELQTVTSATLTPGLWLGYTSGMRITNITGEYVPVTIKTIDPKYLPDHEHSWNDLKDKPFGETTTVKEIFPAQELSLNKVGGCKLPDLLPIKLGEEYKVVWDGVEYHCIAKEGFGEYATDATTWVAVSVIVLGSGLNACWGKEPTDEPFEILFAKNADDASALGYGMQFKLYDSECSSPVLSIWGNVKTVEKISGKYVEGMGYVEETLVELFPVQEITLDDAGRYCAGANFVELEIGKEYTVTFDGVQYQCVAWDFDGGYLALGNGQIANIEYGNGEPFIIVPVESGAIMAPDYAEKTISFGIGGMGETLHTIDPKFLSSAFVVNFATADAQTWTADKTADEIAAAVNAGKEVYGNVMGTGMKVDFLGVMPNGSVTFGRLIPDFSTLLSFHFGVMGDNSVVATLASIAMTPAGGAE